MGKHRKLLHRRHRKLIRHYALIAAVMISVAVIVAFTVSR
jgi:hypothetical protein